MPPRRGTRRAPYKTKKRAAKTIQNAFRRAIAQRRYRRRAIMPAPFPVNKIVKMKYHTTIQMSAGIGLINHHNFSCNSIYDPDQTGVGHQPLGHDEMALLYFHYIVPGSKITVKCIPLVPSASGPPIFWGIRTNGSTTFTYSYDQIVENRGNTFKLLSNAQAVNTLQQLSKGFSLKKFYNITDVKDNFKTLGASFGASPTDEAYFQVFMGSIDTATASNTYVFDITIDYLVSCSERKTLGQS